jgi:Tol biopolymer transport system component
MPDGGNLYVMEAVSGQVRELSDQWVTAPPHWISPTRLAFITSQRGNASSGSSLWWADLRGGPSHKVSGDASGVLVTGDSWTSDGSKVVYQEAGTMTQIVIRDDAGTEIARSADLNFPRVAFAASWSPDGKRLVMGGHNSQCPYGMLLTDDSFKFIVKSQVTPSVCDPSWSPDGHFIAFNGVTQSDTSSDGRSDVFIAEATGFGARNLTGRLGGQIRLLGWVIGS